MPPMNSLNPHTHTTPSLPASSSSSTIPYTTAGYLPSQQPSSLGGGYSTSTTMNVNTAGVSAAGLPINSAVSGEYATGITLQSSTANDEEVIVALLHVPVLTL